MDAGNGSCLSTITDHGRLSIWVVFVCDINEDQLDACTTSLSGAGVIRADVSDASQVDSLFEEAVA